MRKLHRLLLAIIAGSSIFAGALAAETDTTDLAADVRKRAPEEFTVVEEPPFVIASDQQDQAMNQSIVMIRWTVQHLKKDFFEKDPAEPFEIWLFQNKVPYRKYANELFQTDPPSAFGFCLPKRRAILMNAATGGGVLVREITQVFLRTNAPQCPVWFGEGMASLFEQVSERKGHMVGVVNWRVTRLQDAIRAGKTPTFKRLSETSAADFYGDDEDPNYSHCHGEARFLFYYLQEQDLLVKFYRDYLAHARDDPTGYSTLQKVLGEPDMAAFQKKWEAFVLALPVPK